MACCGTGCGTSICGAFAAVGCGAEGGETKLSGVAFARMTSDRVLGIAFGRDSISMAILALLVPSSCFASSMDSRERFFRAR